LCKDCLEYRDSIREDNQDVHSSAISSKATVSDLANLNTMDITISTINIQMIHEITANTDILVSRGVAFSETSGDNDHKRVVNNKHMKSNQNISVSMERSGEEVSHQGETARENSSNVLSDQVGGLIYENSGGRKIELDEIKKSNKPTTGTCRDENIRMHPHKQKSTSSQRGTCSVCLVAFQLNIKDGNLRLHNHIGKRCMGSHKPPLIQRDAGQSLHSFSGSIPDLSNSLTTVSQSQLSVSGLNPDLSTTLPFANSTGSESSTQAPFFDHPNLKAGTIRHIPKCARASCAVYLMSLLNKIQKNTIIYIYKTI